MGQPIIQVDAFTAEPFGGNPAAVCILDATTSDDWMQAVAMEMNLSETAFLHPQDNGYALRWFTPESEVELCGHATLASAHVLYTDGHVPADQPVSFFTKSGELMAALDEDWIGMNFPALPISMTTAPDGSLEALGVQPMFVGKTEFDLFIEVASPEIVRSLDPDIAALKKLPVRGVCVTARENGEFDFISRFFAPAVGINEDSVTGSAHCALCPYWSQKLSMNEFTAYQASRRGGVVRLHMMGDRVVLAGQAVTTLRGELM